MNTQIRNHKPTIDAREERFDYSPWFVVGVVLMAWSTSSNVGAFVVATAAAGILFLTFTASLLFGLSAPFVALYLAWREIVRTVSQDRLARAASSAKSMQASIHRFAARAVGRCPVCASSLKARVVARCERCDTPHHLECWDYNGCRCAIYGCGFRA